MWNCTALCHALIERGPGHWAQFQKFERQHQNPILNGFARGSLTLNRVAFADLHRHQRLGVLLPAGPAGGRPGFGLRALPHRLHRHAVPGVEWQRNVRPFPRIP